jgi:hypothetical protein
MSGALVIQIFSQKLTEATEREQAASKHVNDAVGFMGSAAASAAVRRALAPNRSRKDELTGALVPMQKPTTRASSAAPGAGALPIFNRIVPVGEIPFAHRMGEGGAAR